MPNTYKSSKIDVNLYNRINMMLNSEDFKALISIVNDYSNKTIIDSITNHGIMPSQDTICLVSTLSKLHYIVSEMYNNSAEL